MSQLWVIDDLYCRFVLNGNANRMKNVAQEMSQLDLWDRFLTEDIRVLAYERIRDNSNLATREDLSRATVKIALILVRMMNPAEDLHDAEWAIIMGVGKNQVKSVMENKHFLHTVNR